MCTAATYNTKDHYFGRNLDYEINYDTKVTVIPRNFAFKFRKAKAMERHYAMIGMAYVVDGYPLCFDAINEKGLGMAGLNFEGNADYKEIDTSKDNITPFEFIPWVLGQCANISEAKELLNNINLVNINFSDELPLATLHWIISDKERSIVVECVKEGLKVYDNPVGVLTNNPTFDIQLFNLNNYIACSPKQPSNNFSKDINLDLYSRGMGGIGIPGDLSSSSRFVKVAFTKLNSVSGDSESESISQFFHILGSVNQQKGLTNVGDDKFEYTIYSSCFNLDKGIYYYTTYENSQISAVDMNKEDLESDELVIYPLILGQQINFQN